MSQLTGTCTIRNVTACAVTLGAILVNVGCAQLNVLVAIFTDSLEAKNPSLCPFRGRLYSVGGQSSADRHFVALSDWSRVLLAHQQLVTDSGIVRRVRKN
jgi:hypothetical protein